MFDIKSHHKADTVDEAIRLLSQNPDAVPIAGGTDVLVRLRQGNPEYRHLVDIHDVAELKQVVLAEDGTIIVGSGATFTEIIENTIVRANIPVLAKGAASVGGPQIRNQATVGGNICNGAPSADSAAPLLVLNAIAVMKGPDGERHVPLSEFYHGPGKVDRRHSEIMTGLRISAKDYQCWSAHYHKYAMRDAMDIATIGCAAAMKTKAGNVTGLRLAFTVAGPTPLRCPKTEEMALGAKADMELVRLVSGMVLDDLRPRGSWRAAKDFREHIIQTLAERVLMSVLGDCGEPR